MEDKMEDKKYQTAFNIKSEALVLNRAKPDISAMSLTFITRKEDARLLRTLESKGINSRSAVKMTDYQLKLIRKYSKEDSQKIADNELTKRKRHDRNEETAWLLRGAPPLLHCC